MTPQIRLSHCPEECPYTAPPFVVDARTAKVDGDGEEHTPDSLSPRPPKRATKSTTESSNSTSSSAVMCRDPSSSTSPSSFLRPGVMWSGKQIFVPKAPRTRSHRHHPSPPSLLQDLPEHLSPNARRDHVISAIERLIAARSALERSASHLNSVHSTSTAVVGDLRSRSFPYPGTSSSSSATTAPSSAEQDRERQELLARLRIRIERELANSRTLLDRANATLPRSSRIASPDRRPPGSRNWQGDDDDEPLADQEAEIDDDLLMTKDERRECWSVQVMIMSHDPHTREMTGLMHALGLSPFGARVTTYFTGTVIEPTEGLWTKRFGAKKRDDAEYWARLGPFASRGVSKDELRERGQDEHWLAEITRGWVLMRWKEREFVNVVPSDSTLSIAGYYLIALDRSSGAIEGLYYDPVSSPFQKLTLSVETDRAPFTLSTFEMQ